jgi:hypothetical protein
MRVLRGIVGFMFFHLAFWLRREIAGTAWFALAIGLSGLATLGANFAGPYLRKKMQVQTMLLCSLISVGIVGVGSAWFGNITGGIVLAAVVNAAAAIGRLAFEATVQSGAPDANRGRAFSRFETQNQMAWVAGGLVPVIFAPTGWVGFAIVGVVGVAGRDVRANAWDDYWISRRASHRPGASISLGVGKFPGAKTRDGNNAAPSRSTTP